MGSKMAIRNGLYFDDEVILAEIERGTHLIPSSVMQVIEDRALDFVRQNTLDAMEAKDSKAFMRWAPTYAVLDRAEAEDTAADQFDIIKAVSVFKAHGYAASMIRLDRPRQLGNLETLEIMRVTAELHLALTARRNLAIKASALKFSGQGKLPIRSPPAQTRAAPAAENPAVQVYQPTIRPLDDVRSVLHMLYDDPWGVELVARKHSVDQLFAAMPRDELADSVARLMESMNYGEASFNVGLIRVLGISFQNLAKRLGEKANEMAMVFYTAALPGISYCDVEHICAHAIPLCLPGVDKNDMPIDGKSPQVIAFKEALDGVISRRKEHERKGELVDQTCWQFYTDRVAQKLGQVVVPVPDEAAGKEARRRAPRKRQPKQPAAGGH
jgi:hypothetical protein